MIAHVFKRKRKRDGKTVTDRNYRGRYRLDGDYALTEVTLNTRDKQVAEKRLRDIVQEKERERMGLIAPKLERESAEKPLAEHLVEFVADLKAKGRTEKYIKLLNGRVARLLKGTKWKFPKDITADAFIGWRARQKIAPKTVNEYLNSINALLNWMAKNERILDNPLRNVERVDLRGKQQLRRALTDEELNKLLDAAEEYRLLYLTAAYTGLRLGELKQLLWADVNFDDSRPFLLVRASTTKNKKQAIVPLHPLLIPEFTQASELAEGGDFVFPQHRHPDRKFGRHADAAGLERIDAAGRKIDFHSLRYTFATKLARQGVSQRLAQELMRHSDPRLTANLYTDVAHLPTFDAVGSLPWHAIEAPEKWTHIGTQNADFSGQKLSRTGKNDSSIFDPQSVDLEGL